VEKAEVRIGEERKERKKKRKREKRRGKG